MLRCGSQLKTKSSTATCGPSSVCCQRPVLLGSPAATSSSYTTACTQLKSFHWLPVPCRHTWKDPAATRVYSNYQRPHRYQCTCSWLHLSSWLCFLLLYLCLQFLLITSDAHAAGPCSWGCAFYWLWPVLLHDLVPSCCARRLGLPPRKNKGMFFSNIFFMFPIHFIWDPVCWSIIQCQKYFPFMRKIYWGFK